jgi:carbonic anhydrase
MESHIASALPVSRRKALGLLSLSTAALAGGGLAAAPLHAEVLPVDAALPDIRTPSEALAELMAGNGRFVAGRTVGPHRNMARVQELSSGQTPFASVLSCADSRVPVEILFDQGFGDVFVCRAAGNIVTPEMIGSLEFGTAVLGSQALVVLGHTSCGAVKATIAGTAVPGQISTLYQHIQPAVDATPGRELEAVARQNARMQASLLRTASPVIGGLVRENKLVVVPAVYDISTGRVTLLDP